MMGFLIGLTEAGYQTDVKSENFTSINDFGIMNFFCLVFWYIFPFKLVSGNLELSYEAFGLG